MTEPACANCRFFSKPTPAGFGYCRRHPAFVEHINTAWCGEHKPIVTVTSNHT